MEAIDSSLARFIGRDVVLDTTGPTTYLGTLREICADGFWLEDADIRDRTEGHVTKERYVCEARKLGINVNRKRIFVFREIVNSCSALEDVIID